MTRGLLGIEHVDVGADEVVLDALEVTTLFVLHVGLDLLDEVVDVEADELADLEVVLGLVVDGTLCP